MGCFDSVNVPCPNCRKRQLVQSKSGPCSLSVYEMEEAPGSVLSGANRHGPFICDQCGEVFRVAVTVLARTVPCEPAAGEG